MPFTTYDRQVLYAIYNALKGSVPMFEEIIAAVEEQTNAVDGAVTVINGLAAKVAELVEAGTVTPEQVTALANSIKANSQKLAEAIAANTPAEE